LQEKLKGAADLDAVLAIAKEAGFDISKAAWLRYQANQTLELSDEELEGIAGGTMLPLRKPAWLVPTYVEPGWCCVTGAVG